MREKKGKYPITKIDSINRRRKGRGTRRPGFPRHVDYDRIPASHRFRIRETATTQPSDTQIFDVTSNHHPDVLAVRQYWEERRRGRLMPARAEIDPLDLRLFLPGIILIDVVDDARRYVYRLVGTREVAMRGRDPTGKSVIDGYFATSLQEALSILDRVVASRAPLFLHRDFTAPDGRLGNEDMVMMPLSDDGETVNKLFGYTHHHLF